LTKSLLGRPLEEALRQMRSQGVEPAVVISRAPRRPEGVGSLRVVRVRAEGRELTACAFLDKVEKP